MTRLSRRRLLLGGLTFTALAAATPRTVLAQPLPSVEARIAELEQRHSRLIGVYATDLASGRSIAHRAQDRFAMCSTFKTYAAAAALQRVQRGELDLDRPLFVAPAAIVAHSPRSELHAGKHMPLAELCAAAVQVSDNGAANVLLQTLGGPGAITAFARSIGDSQSRLDRWETELNAAIPGDPRDTSTPEALGNGYRAVLTGDVLSPPLRRQLEDWMRANQTSAMRAGLPPEWTSADKTGAGDYGSTNDVGIAYGPAGERILLAIMIRSEANDPNAGNMRPLIGELTGLVVPTLRA